MAENKTKKEKSQEADSSGSGARGAKPQKETKNRMAAVRNLRAAAQVKAAGQRKVRKNG